MKGFGLDCGMGKVAAGGPHRLQPSAQNSLFDVTHDERMIGELDRVLQLVDGRVVSNGSNSKAESSSAKAETKFS
jgi:Fe-S cluster assembly ATPase SufC